MPKTRCLNCDTLIKVDKLHEGDTISCPGCGVELEIISTDPFVVDFTEDWQEELEEEWTLHWLVGSRLCGL